MKVHLVDGTFELFRCFHGAPRAYDVDGNEVGAVRGLLFTLVALLRPDDVTHVAVAFDQMASRSTDGSASALLRRQYMPAAEAVRVLGVPVWPMHRHQADDALATGAARYAALMVRNLSILRTDLPIPDDVDDLEWRGAHRARLEQLVHRIGGDEVLDRLSRWRDD